MQRFRALDSRMHATDPSYGPMTDTDLPAVARILSHAFAGTREGSAEWVQNAGLGHLRTLRAAEGGAIEATLLRIPMGQYFGGRSVPLVGIAGVGVAPEARGRGVAGRLMAEAVREIASEGVALSGLYPATQPLYRRVGYEQAGHRFEYRLPVRNIGGGERGMRVRPVEATDKGAIRECYTEFASRFDGPLDRGEYLWGRVERMRETVYYGFAAVDEAGEIEGYIYLAQTRKPERGRQDIAVSDIAFRTAAAGRRLLGFLADFSSMADDIVFFGGPLHPLCTLLAEQRYQLSIRDHWMIRITNLPEAITARGYRCEAAEVHLDVRDELLPKNSGKWVVRVRDGAGFAERGGSGAISLDVAALASMYSGLYTPEQLSVLGRCTGEVSRIRAAAGLFAGTTPWMSDMY
jgi:predicted acetyltransferase